jgi:glucosamine--fructose-6-phosphate aminotransferase (isomerizing)
LTPALKRLEYRGYDSAGMATLDGRRLAVRKSAGKVAVLERLLSVDGPGGQIGIAHTRWATHGRPSDVNAHPQVDCREHIAVVHNGIIENFRELRAHLTADGHRFRSETDTEVVAHLIESFEHLGWPEAAGRAARELRGSFAIACISEAAPKMLIAIRSGFSPLVVGLGRSEAFVASDMSALLGKTQEAIVLEEGEMACLTEEGVTIRRLTGQRVDRGPTPIQGDLESVEKGGHPHFMLKEIFEQPKAVRDTLAGRIADNGRVTLDELGLTDRELADVRRVTFIGCGTSWHAGLVGRYLVEDLARLPSEVEIASELRHRRPIVDRDVLAVPISQSGETADTLAALQQVRASRARAIAITNVVGSSVTREANGTLYTVAGLEIGVAATKTFTSQIAAVLLLALKLAEVRRMIDRDAAVRIAAGLRELPDLMTEVFDRSNQIRQIARRIADQQTALYLGRGLQYPLALEGALKAKEIAYIHAEGYPAGEMKHGPIALIDHGVPVIALAPSGPTLQATVSGLHEVKARDAQVIAVMTEGDDELRGVADDVIETPAAPPWLQPMLLAIPMQLLAYHLAVLRGCDVDQPRNLAKSVTVE